MISRFIKRYSTRFFPQTEAEVGKAVWTTISGATMARVALQLGRLSILDKPLGMPLNILDLFTNRQHSSILPQLLPNDKNMGTEPRFQPSSVDVAADEESIFPVLDQQKPEDEQSIPVAPPPAHAIDIIILHSNGSQLSLMIPPALIPNL